ncbi:unnamed protein product [Amoebophrya sp. A25]|nr:unnamed protein product [Amoebophrya sp. A25]|eukprot:GSA25T00023894001.1
MVIGEAVAYGVRGFLVEGKQPGRERGAEGRKDMALDCIIGDGIVGDGLCGGRRFFLGGHAREKTMDGKMLLWGYVITVLMYENKVVFISFSPHLLFQTQMNYLGKNRANPVETR